MVLNDRIASRKSGAALVIVLSIIAILSVIVVAFLGTSSREVTVSQQSLTNTQGPEVSELAVSQVLQDLLLEIKAGSVEPVLSGTFASSPKVYYPATPMGAMPDRSSAVGATSGAMPPPNLLKQSARDRPAYDAALLFNGEKVYPQAALYPVTPRASTVSAGESAPDGLSSARWNLPLLLPRLSPNKSDDLTPATSGMMRYAGKSTQKWAWDPPDWVYLQRDGKTPLVWSSDMLPRGANPVVARYAFQMYDVGGLLDLNVAGYDPDQSVVGDQLASRRGSTAFADLTQLGLTAQQLKTLVGIRNQATLAGKDGFSGKSLFGNPYVNFALSGKTNFGFMRVGGDPLGAGGTNKAFSSRQGMLSFLRQLAGTNETDIAALLEASQSLTHFSRALEQPSFRPGFYDITQTDSTPVSPVFTKPSIVPPAGRIDDRLYSIDAIPPAYLPATDKRKRVALGGPLPWDMGLSNNRGGNDAWGTIVERGGVAEYAGQTLQDIINPGFLELRVKKSFLRQDGSMAVVGEPFLKKRFPLERLSWITYRGPSAELPENDPQYNAAGTKIAIYDCFGLVWTTDVSGVSYWAYNHGKMGGIYKLRDINLGPADAPLAAAPNAPKGAKTAPREPDFFELLKAGIGVGSLGKTAMASHYTSKPWDAATYQQTRDRSTEFQTLEIGANIIDQYDIDSFPTIIKLPNSDTGLVPADPKRYAPALFTARGVEDIPYFYRLLWRAIEDSKDTPTIALPPPGGIREVTGNLSPFLTSSYKPGTTHIIAFPELWNPHAVNGAGVDAKWAPSEFRVVAASETPSDLLKGPDRSETLDMGLTNSPKMGDVLAAPSTRSDANKMWFQLANEGDFGFVIRPVGYFAYNDPRKYSEYYRANPPNQFMSGPSTSMLTWAVNTTQSLLSAGIVSGNTSSGGISYENLTWSWPREDVIASDFAYQAAGAAVNGVVFRYDKRFSGLFWSDLAPRNRPNQQGLDAATPGDPSTGVFLAFYPMWRLPLNCTSEQDFVDKFTLPMPTGASMPVGVTPSMPVGWTDWPGYLRARLPATFQPIDTGVATRAAIPAPASSDPLDTLPLRRTTDGKLYSWDATTNAYMEFSWPAILDPFRTFGTATYAVGQLSTGPGPLVSATSNKSILNGAGTYPSYRYYLRALSDKTGLSRSLIETNTSQTKQPFTLQAVTAAPWGSLDTPTMNLSSSNIEPNNRVVDVRGTELRFTSSANLFREPTPLCQPNQPNGSNLTAGPDNFYSLAPYLGGVTGTDGNQWVGFSLGEVPTQFIVASKIYKRDEVVVKDVFSGINKLIRSTTDVPADLYQNKRGSLPADVTEQGISGAKPWQKVVPPLTGSLNTFYRLRLFQVPVNVAGILATRMTIRLQFKDPIAGQWVTYDERYIEVDDAGGKYASSPVLGSTELQADEVPDKGGADPQSVTGDVTWRDNKRSIGWTLPLVTSYDPRTPRFGQPQRYAYDAYDTVRGTSPRILQMVNQDAVDPWKPGFLSQKDAAGLPVDWTDRPQSTIVDPATGTMGPLTMKLAFGIPGAWNNGDVWGKSKQKTFSDYQDAYTYVTGKQAAPAISENGYNPGNWGVQWWARGLAARLNNPGASGQAFLFHMPSANALDFGWYPRQYKPMPAGSKTAWVTPDTNWPRFGEPGNTSSTYADTLRMGSMSENVSPYDLHTPIADANAAYRQAYADPDDVVRRASGAYARDGGYSTIEGLPMGQGNTAKAANRPIMLNRPFRSVVDMGAAFRGSPWKHVDFFLPESADAPLLDLFSVTEAPPAASTVATGSASAVAAAPPLVAGKVNLNTRQEPVLRAMMAGALKDELNEGDVLSTVAGDATRAATLLIDRTTGSKAWLGPLTNIAELVGKLFAKDSKTTFASTDPVYTAKIPRTLTEPKRNPDMVTDPLTWHFTGFSADLDTAFVATKDRKTKRLRESVLRALADGGQTRVWNVMLDMVVQAGRLRPAASDLSQFVKEGENRVWVFMAIDRLTGEVLDQQVEWVTN